MPVRKIILPDGRRLAFGRNPPPPQAKRPLHLAKYMTGGSPHMPDIIGVPERPDWASGAWTGLGDIDGNDTSGDCCYAAIMHLICCVMAATGVKNPTWPSKTEAWDLYSRVNVASGNPAFDPNIPSTDIGGDLPTVMNYLMTNSAIQYDPSWQAEGWLTVDASKPDEIRTAIWLFGGTYKALCLPSTGGPSNGGYTTPMPSGNGFIWDVAGPPDPSQGHCIVDYGANVSQGSFIDTWGMEGVMTYEANAKYCTLAGAGEMHAILWKSWKEVGQQIAPNAIDYNLLEEDLKTWGQ